jgi:cysteine-rich repeat protein
VCIEANEVATASPNGCNGATQPGDPALFFVTRQSSNGCGVCATGSRTDSDCNSSACTSGCLQTEQISNDVFGCGNYGAVPASSCTPLNAFSNAFCSAIAPQGWSCDAAGPADDSGVCETFTLVHTNAATGGVLCCRDGSSRDTDGDGVLDEVDNCPAVANPNQEDTDSDGFGDACDRCGNGTLEPGEVCDDGNTANGDGCSTACAIEPCWSCTGLPSACAPLPAGIACADDGNPCTDDLCDGNGNCGVPNTAPCDDGLFCTGTDTCAGGSCAHTGDPCTARPQCDDVCDEAQDQCVSPFGTPCADDGNPCTVDRCDGSGGCTHPAGNAGTECRADAGQCDVAEQCDGFNTACPPNAFEPNTTNCNDGSVCTQTDRCNGAGICAGSNLLNCSDGTICTADTCHPVNGCDNPPARATDCKTSQKALLILKQNGGGGDKQLFKWIKGDAVSQAEVADPTAATDYAVCVYSGATNELLESFSVPAAGGNWSPLGDKGYKYKELTGTNGGLTGLLLKGGDAGRTKVLVKGKGGNLPDPTLDSMPLPVTAQVINPDTGVCVEAVFDTPNVKKNSSTLFKANTP